LLDKINYQYHKPIQKSYRAIKRDYSQILSDEPKNLNNDEISIESSFSNNSNKSFLNNFYNINSKDLFL